MAFEEGSQIKTQKWMEILESKNQKSHKLAHDLGAGSPCLQCKDTCPGLDLHFWRKVCKNCKCKKEAHDVQEEDDVYSKFEILFGISKCIPSQAVLDLKLRFPSDENQDERVGGVGVAGGGGAAATAGATNFPSSSSNKKYTFDWIPPNVSSELAAEYMEHLPTSKLPISGSDGALYRRQQLEKQVPLHDLNANMCHNLTADEIKSLSDYLENLKANAAGQGKIMKLPNLLNVEEMSSATGATSSGTGIGGGLLQKQSQTSFPTSFSADSISSIYNTVPKPFKPMSDGSHHPMSGDVEFPPPPPELLQDDPEGRFSSHLKTPSAFIKPSRTPSPQALLRDGVSGSLTTASVGSNSTNEPFNEEDNNKNVKVGDFVRSLNSQANQMSKPLAGVALSGSGGPGDHPVHQPKPYESKLNSVKIEAFNQHDEQINAPNRSVTKHLDNINRNLVTGMPPSMSGRGLVPTGTQIENGTHNSGSGGVRVTNLDDLLAQNMSRTNLNDRNMNPTINTSGVATNLNNLPQLREYHAGDVHKIGGYDPNQTYGKGGNVAGHPGGPNDVQVAGNRYTSGVGFGPNNVKDVSIGDVHRTGGYNGNSYDKSGNVVGHPGEGGGYGDGQVGVHRHTGVPQGTVLGPHGTEHVPSGHVARTVTNNKKCKHCTMDIKYGELAIYTEKLGDTVLWHPQCFVCDTCHELLVDLMYFHYKSNVYCLRDYAQMLNIPRCFACDELIFVNEYTLAEDKTYHVKHFCCYECDKELCNQSYIPVREGLTGNRTPIETSEDTTNTHPHCLDCYYRLFSKKCATCLRTIDVKDKCIQFNNAFYWHIDGQCFSCAQCRKSLSNEKFIMQFEKPFCSRQCVLAFSETQ